MLESSEQITSRNRVTRRTFIKTGSATGAVVALNLVELSNVGNVAERLAGIGLAYAQDSETVQTDYIPWSSPYWWPRLKRTANLPRLSDVNEVGKAPTGPCDTYDKAVVIKYGEISKARDCQEQKELEYEAEFGGNPFGVAIGGYCSTLAFAGIFEPRPIYLPGRMVILDGQETDIPLSQPVLEGLLILKRLPDRSVPITVPDEVVDELQNNRPIVFQSPAGWFRAGYKFNPNNLHLFGTNFINLGQLGFEKEVPWEEILSMYAIDRGDGSQKFPLSYIMEAEKLRNEEIKHPELLDEIVNG